VPFYSPSLFPFLFVQLLGGLRNGGAGSIQVKAEKTDYLDARRGMAVFSLDVPDKG
jgi:hypothetical protein